MKLLYREKKIESGVFQMIKSEVLSSRKEIEKKKAYFRSKDIISTLPDYMADGTDHSFFHLRGSVRNGKKYYDDLEFVDDPIFLESFPQLYSFLENFATEKKSIVGRVCIMFLSSKQLFKPHIDRGDFYMVHRRYHLVIQTNGSRMYSAHQKALFQDGDLFYLNNRELHTGDREDSPTERIHIIIDLLPSTSMGLLKVFGEWFICSGKYKHLYKLSLISRIKKITVLPKAYYLANSSENRR